MSLSVKPQEIKYSNFNSTSIPDAQNKRIEFVAETNRIINDAIDDPSLSIRYAVDQLYDLFQKYPALAEKIYPDMPKDYQDLKKLIGSFIEDFRLIRKNEEIKRDETSHVYRCKQPLKSIGGEGLKTGPDISINLLYHEYLCAQKSNKTVECGGQDRSHRFPYIVGPGQPSHDDYKRENCVEISEIENIMCVSQCVVDELHDKRPFYSVIGPGTNCQEYVEDVLDKCITQCEE